MTDAETTRNARRSGKKRSSRSTAPVILQIVPTLTAGGVERTTIDIASALGRHGFKPLVASKGGWMEKELSYTGAELIRLPMATKNPLVMILNAFRLARIIRRRKVALIHARSRAPAWSARWAARRTGIPFVTTYAGIYNGKGGLKKFYNSVMARGDAVIANSRWTAQHIADNYSFKPKLLAVIPRGIAFDHFNPQMVPPQRISAIRGSWAARADDRVVLLPGRLTRWKGQPVFIEAFAILARSKRLPPGVRGVMVGDEQGRKDYVAGLDAAIVKNGLQHIMLVSGPCQDMPAAYLASEIVVSASTDPEAFGRVAAEASAMGRPVIATDHGGARETVVDRETGLLVPPGDTNALADAIHDLLARSDAERAAMGAAGRAHVQSRFTLERMCDDTLSLYRRLLA